MSPSYFYRIAVKLAPVTASKRDWTFKTPRVHIRLEDWFRKTKPIGVMR